MMTPIPRSEQSAPRITDDCGVAAPLARRMREARAGLTLRWLERISDRVTVDEAEVFPTRDLLNHVPLLIEAISEYVENPADEGVVTDQVIGKASELGQMRFEQGFSPYQILKEFEILGGILLSFLAREADELHLDCTPGELLVCAHRLHHALALVQQATAARYLALLDAFASEREQRLRSVRELLEASIGPGLARLADGDDIDAPEADRIVDRLRGQVEHAVALAGMPSSARMQRNVPLKAVIGEAMRLVRELAQQREVELRVQEPLPPVDVYAAVVELCLVAFLTNAIKHGIAPGGGERWVEIGARLDDTERGRRLVVSVRDNGNVIPPQERERLFRPFMTETVTDDDQPGLGLSLVREAVEALGGRSWVEEAHDPTGSRFCFELPSRRAEDRDADAAGSMD